MLHFFFLFFFSRNVMFLALLSDQLARLNKCSSDTGRHVVGGELSHSLSLVLLPVSDLDQVDGGRFRRFRVWDCAQYFIYLHLFLSPFLGVSPQMYPMKGSRFALSAQLELSICCALTENPHAEIKPLLFWSLISSAASLKSKCWFDASQMFFF